MPADLDPVDAARFATESAVIRILDSAYWAYDLEIVWQSNLFRRRVDRYIRRHPDEWERALAGLTWAHDSARCAGEVWRPGGDVRWPYFVRFGPPSSWWVTDYDIDAPGGGRDTVAAYFYWWDTRDSGLAAQAESTNAYPSKLLYPIVETTLAAAKPIHPVIDIVSFPSRDGTFDIWVTGAVWGDDLTRATITAGTLQAAVSLFGENRGQLQRLLDTLSQTRDLGLAGLVLAVTVNKMSLSIPFYFELAGLQRGRYTLEFSVVGAHNNAGGEKKTFVLPSPYAADGTSDILLIDRYGPRGPGIAPRVRRENRELQGIPMSAFNIGDTLSPYVEMRLPKGENWAYTVSVYLRPMQRDARGTVQVGAPVLFADSLGEPLFRWAGVDLTRELRELQRQSPPGKDGLELLFAGVYQPESDLGVFESSFAISPRMRTGDYWLVIDFNGNDRTGRDFRRSVQKRISVTKPGIRW